jgi:hypothetical protein
MLRPKPRRVKARRARPTGAGIRRVRRLLREEPAEFEWRAAGLVRYDPRTAPLGR